MLLKYILIWLEKLTICSTTVSVIGVLSVCFLLTALALCDIFFQLELGFKLIDIIVLLLISTVTFTIYFIVKAITRIR